jgi:hypothetical protein
MSWAPGRDAILGMLDRNEIESVIASAELAEALQAQASEAIDTAREAANSGRWYSAYANLWDGVRKALSALLRPVPRMRSTRNDTEYPDPDTQIEPAVVLADLEKARDIVTACSKVLPHLTVFQR